MKGKSAGNIRFRPNVPDIPRIREKASRDLCGYYGAIENLDWNVGRIVDTLQRLGLYENTHILFFSDHGDMHGSHGQFLKTSPHEESIRIPLILSGVDPTSYGPLRSGNTDALCTNVDLGPTSLGLCGLPVPDSMAGRDLSALRLNREDEPVLPDSAYIQIVKPTGHPDSVERSWRGIVSDDGWKYVCLEGGLPWLLFNLNEDPYEQANLALNPRFAENRQKLHDRLRQWVRDTEDEFDLPNLV
ncbi:sulfatase-like hydrolase/transferase [Puniceicoccus vermicola]|uniref:Sulfatase-like hydrolase/transferase n=1 Tax=Puniceicoccus vermicola TaxID=388746 RepID=A0A7X1B1B3_9BACT|nr:sulfatase-like hydrolase/transferase [Puniceicoccus vermicola]MBC2603788.1 sulfatase-like hydrolase/transferase [Puniceicoccus vermicola]